MKIEVVPDGLDPIDLTDVSSVASAAAGERHLIESLIGRMAAANAEFLPSTTGMAARCHFVSQIRKAKKKHLDLEDEIEWLEDLDDETSHVFSEVLGPVVKARRLLKMALEAEEELTKVFDNLFKYRSTMYKWNDIVDECREPSTRLGKARHKNYDLIKRARRPDVFQVY